VPVLVVEHARAKVVRPRAERRREAEPAETEIEHQQASAGSEDQGGGSGEHGGSGDDAPELDSGEGH
jgi:hypothetical protein